jgi:hypothetical protein
MLSAHFHALSPAAGHRYADLVLTNSSSQTCQTFGYPGMQLLTSAGSPVPTNMVRLRPVTPLLITLHPGESAWTMLRWSVIPGPGESQTSACEATPSTAWVTPPDETTHLTVSWTMGMVCERGTIDVNPLARGTGPA